MSYFNSLVGQERIKIHMEELIRRGTLPHSLLFYGERGLGKLTMAKGIASTLLGRPVLETLPEEPVSLYTDRGQVFLMSPMTATGLKISQWQQLLKDYLSKASVGIRIVIIDGFETARPDFMNALLKSIEEPPQGVYFILITTKKDFLLPTIISRCMLVPFVPVRSHSLEENLLKKAFTILHGLGASKRPFSTGVLSLQGIEKVDLLPFLEAFRLLGRDMLAIKYGAQEDVLYCPQFEKRLDSLASHWSNGALQSMVDETLKAEEALRLNIRTALVVDGLLLALRRAIKE